MRSTWAAARCGFVATAVTAAGLWLGRPDVVTLAVPFLVALALAAGVDRPTVAARLRLPRGRVREREHFEVVVAVTADRDVPLARVDLHVPAGFRANGPLTHAAALVAGRPAEFRWSAVTPTWGKWRVGPVDVTLTAPTYLLESSEPDAATGTEIRVVPMPPVFDSAQPVPTALAYAGAHRSRTSGPGVEFAGVRDYQVGDALRRINWRATNRAQSLQVNTTQTDRSASVTVLLDTANNAGPRGASILDNSVRAAAAIAEHYIGLGDTVRLLEYGGQNRALPAGTGRAHLARIQEGLLDAGGGTAAAAYASAWLARQRLGGSLVIVVTPLLDNDAAANIVTVRRQVTTIAVVDVLPAGVLPAPRDELATLAMRAWRLERRELIDRMSDLGIPTIPWKGPGTLDTVLRQLTRVAQAPRAALR